jgi:photosystem II stability/assembly factor-like uncharacterized protein
MKKLLSILLLLLCQFSFAQLEIIGSKEYGRLYNLIYDPVVQNRIYATTIRNHIVISNDNGLNWEIFYSFPTTNNKEIKKLKFHNSNQFSFTLNGDSHENKIYIIDIATKEIVWEYSIPIPENSDGSAIYSYYFYDDDTVIVNQWYGILGAVRAKVYYTNSKGLNWDMIYYNGDYGYIFPNFVAISPSNPEKLYIARLGGLDSDDYGGLLISENAGQAWEEKLSGSDLGPIVFHPNNPNDILIGTWLGSGSYTHLYRSLDNGDNWNDVFPELSSEMLNGILDLQYNPSDNNNIVALGVNEIMRTYDNFQTKEVIQYENDMYNPNNYFFGVSASFNPFNTSQLVLATNDYPLMTSNGGASVSRIENKYFLSQNGQLNIFKNETSKHLYYAVQNGFSHRDLATQNETPHNIFPLQFLPNVVSKFYCDKYIEGRVYAANQGFDFSNFAVSNDHGATFFGVQSPSLYLHKIVSKPENSNILFCSLSNDYEDCNLEMFDITDIENVQQTSIVLPIDGFLSDIHFDVNDTSVMWVALGNRIYKTSDYGENWELQSNGLEELNSSDRINQITQNLVDNSQLTIATTKGIFTSVDNGNSWYQISSFIVNYVEHSDTNSDYIVAITYGGGHNEQIIDFTLRYSNDAGVTWQQIPYQDLLYIFSDQKNATVDFNGDTADVYVGTYDLGVLKYTIDLTTLGQSEFENNLNVITSPNPAKNIINVQTTETIKEVSVYNLLGKKVTVNQLSTNSIDVSNLAQGVYIIKVMNEDDKMFSSKFIKE